MALGTEVSVLTTSKRSRETVVKERRRGCNWTPVTASGTPSLTADLPVNPEQVIQQREKEKSLLVEVNRMLADYVGKVEFYKTENVRLSKDLGELEKKYKDINEKLDSKYDAELIKLRTDLKEEKVEKESLRVKVVRLEDELTTTKEKLEKEELENLKLKESIPKMEKMISERDGQIDFLTRTMESMELELKKLKEANLSMKRDFSLLRQEGDDEAIVKMELLSQLQSKDEELAFLSSAHDEWRRSILPFEVASENYAMEFSNELSSTLRDIRAEYEAILHVTESQNSNEWYKKKFDQLISMSKTQSGEVDNLKQRLRESREKNDSLTVALRQLESQAKIKEASLAELTRQLAKEEEDHRNTHDELTAKLRDQMAHIKALMEQLRELTDIRLRLNEEIATYKRLMDAFGASPFRLADIPIPCFADEERLYREYYERVFTARGFVKCEDINTALDFMAEKLKDRKGRNHDKTYVGKMLALSPKFAHDYLSFEEFQFAMELEKVLNIKENFEKADSSGTGTLPKQKVLTILSETGYDVDDDKFLKKYEIDGKSEKKMVSFPEMVKKTLQCFAIDETKL